MNTEDLIKELNAAVSQVAVDAVSDEAALLEYQQQKAIELYAKLDNSDVNSYLRCVQLVSNLAKGAISAIEQKIGQPLQKDLALQALQLTESKWFEPAVEFIDRKKSYTAARMKAEATQ